MNSNAQALVIAGALFAFFGVGLGAFGAHALKGKLAPDMLVIFQTGVQYHLWHALGVILIGVLAHLLPAARALPIAGWLMVAGIALFSGSLYALSVTGIRMLGAITPLGGLAFLLAWGVVAYAVWRAV